MGTRSTAAAHRAILPLLAAALLVSCGAGRGYEPRDGDIVFHTSRSAQSLAIQRATRSRYSHMGIVLLRRGSPFVLEAVEPVKLTPLGDWLARGEGGHVVVKRLADADSVLTDAARARMLEEGKRLEGRHYDLTFEWSDDRVYCSELVYKVYQRALGIELGRLQRLGDFDLSDPAVRAKVRERFGDRIPVDEPVISPAAIFASDRLVTVCSR